MSVHKTERVRIPPSSSERELTVQQLHVRPGDVVAKAAPLVTLRISEEGGEHVVFAPFRGRVTELRARVGAVAHPNDTMVVLEAVAAPVPTPLPVPRRWPVRGALATALVLVVIVGLAYVLGAGKLLEGDGGGPAGTAKADSGTQIQQVEQLNRCGSDVPWRTWNQRLDLKPSTARALVVLPGDFKKAGQPGMRLEVVACALRPKATTGPIKSGDKFVVAWLARGAAGAAGTPLCITLKFSRARLLQWPDTRHGRPQLLVKQGGRRDYRLNAGWPAGSSWAAGRFSMVAQIGAAVGVYAGRCNGTVVGQNLELGTT